MAHKIDELDLTPPDVDAEYFNNWLIENFSRVRQTLIDGYTGSVVIGTDTFNYEFGVLISIT